MHKAYKISLITYNIIILSGYYSANLLAYPPSQLALVLKFDEVEDARSSPLSGASTAKYSHSTYKITQVTKKINTTLVRNGADLLVRFTNSNNQVVVQVSDVRGQSVHSVYHDNMEAGFYEIPVLPANGQSALYFVSLVINQQAYSFQVLSRP
ncbi:MAG: hypothetical protein AAF944_20610 [Bacteroidota bacterium]